MKAKSIATASSRWPIGLGLADFAERAPADSSQTPRFPQPTTLGPIELRIDGSDGPSAIAILE